MPSNMELKRISASPAPATGVRKAPQVAKLIDTTTCIGCKACEVACQEWNDLLGIDESGPAQVEFGSYQTQPDLTANFWNLIDRKSTRLNSSHLGISYAVFCLKKKK